VIFYVTYVNYLRYVKVEITSKEHLKMCFQQACVWVPISTAMLSRTSMLSACAACSRAILARPLSTDEIIDLLSVTLAGCCCCCCC